jgi:hypothetical protein
VGGVVGEGSGLGGGDSSATGVKVITGIGVSDSAFTCPLHAAMKAARMTTNTIFFLSHKMQRSSFV